MTDIENRFRTPGLSTTVYLPWISYAYQHLWNALAQTGQRVREELFGDVATVSIAQSTLETDIVTNIPRFGGLMKIEVLYGASGDTRNEATRLRSKAFWSNLNNVSTDYNAKNTPLYYISGGKLGIIPIPPEAGANAYVYYIKRPYQLDASTDVIDIPYRFVYPILTYVQARTMERLFEDYFSARFVQQQFEKEVEEVCQAAEAEYNENDGTEAVEFPTGDVLYDNPLGDW